MNQNSPPEVNEFLTRQAKDWHGDAKMPPHVTEAVRAAVFGKKKIGWIPQLSRRQIAVACVFMVPVSFVATRYVAGWLMPNPTLAAITKAMSEVRTAQWQNETEVRDPETGALVRTLRQRYRVDPEQPAARVELEPDQLQIINSEGTFSLELKRFVRLVPPKDSVTLRESLRRMILNGREVFKNKGEWEIGDIVVDGRRLLKLRRAGADAVPATKPIPGRPSWGNRQEIWADPETFRIVQIRNRFKYAETEPPHRVLDVTNTASRYEYDKPIPSSVFQVIAPER